MAIQTKESKNWATFLAGLAFLVSLLSLGTAGLTLFQMSQLRQEISELKQLASDAPTTTAQVPQSSPPVSPATPDQPTATAQPSSSPDAAPTGKIYQSQGSAGKRFSVYPFTVSLKELRRSGNVIIASFSFTNNGGGNMDIDKSLAKNGTSPNDVNTISATYLVDPSNQKKYEVMRDGNNNPTCTRIELIRYDQTVDMYAQFAAPPLSTKTMNVYFPQAGPFINVPIQ
jgi:hypothetical protein